MALLPIVLGTIFILLVLVTALHYQQATSRQKLMRAEARVNFEQGRRFALVGKTGTNSASEPSSVAVSGSLKTSHASEFEPLVATRLFSDDGLPDLSIDEPSTTSETRGFDHYSIEPTTSDLSLRVFGDRTWQTVVRDSAAYAAYAPKGKVTIDEAVAWANPTFKSSTTDAGETYSGQGVVICGQNDVVIDKLLFGYAYSKTKVEIKEGLGVGFLQDPPLRAYESQLQTALSSAMLTMQGTAMSGDRTNNIAGNVFSKIATLFTFLTGKSEPSFLPTLEEAMGLNLPIIPVFANTIPSVFIEFYFFVPFVSDTADFEATDEGKDLPNQNEELQKLKDAYEAKKKAADDLQTQYDNESDPDKKDDLKADLDAARDAEEKALKKWQDATTNVQDNADANANQIKSQIPSKLKDPPTTREEDKSFDKKNGSFGWNYSWIIDSFASLIKGAITGDFGTALDAIAPKVRIVHFGDKDNDASTNFDISTTFSGAKDLTSEVTWVVPRARTFRFDGDMTVTGDIWVQKGGVFSVTGNLTLAKPAATTAQDINPFYPKGRLILEEGATLVVGKDFEAVGNRTFGSVLVGSRPGEVHPITSAILCGGNVTLRHGTFAAATLDELAAWVGEETGSTFLVDSGTVLTSIFVNVVPNLAKIAGPFHMRRPYFAQYATTFQVTFIPTPVGTIPVPTPIPLPHRNLYNPVLRGLTYIYTPYLNWTLGENLFTHADWWAFGQGAVPVVPKIDPVKAALGMQNFNLNGISVTAIDWEEEISSFRDDIIQTVLSYVIQTLLKQLINKVIVKAALPGGSFLGILIDEVLDGVGGALGFDDTVDNLGDLLTQIANRAMEPFKDRLEEVVEQLKDKVYDAVDDGILREVPGLLVYADSIDIGYTSGIKNSFQPMVTAGMFVAKTSFRANVRNVIGTVTVFDGDITIDGRLLYLPYFSRASLFVPPATESDSILRGAEFLYGKAYVDSKGGGTAVDISTGLKQVVAEGWSR